MKEETKDKCIEMAVFTGVIAFMWITVILIPGLIGLYFHNSFVMMILVFVSFGVWLIYLWRT